MNNLEKFWKMIMQFLGPGIVKIEIFCKVLEKSRIFYILEAKNIFKKFNMTFTLKLLKEDQLCAFHF